MYRDSYVAKNIGLRNYNLVSMKVIDDTLGPAPGGRVSLLENDNILANPCTVLRDC